MLSLFGFGKKKRKTSKKVRKIPKRIKKLCKKYHIKLSRKRGSKRVSKTLKQLLKEIKKKRKSSKKVRKSSKKIRKTSFGLDWKFWEKDRDELPTIENATAEQIRLGQYKKKNDGVTNNSKTILDGNFTIHYTDDQLKKLIEEIIQKNYTGPRNYVIAIKEQAFIKEILNHIRANEVNLKTKNDILDAIQKYYDKNNKIPYMVYSNQNNQRYTPTTHGYPPNYYPDTGRF